jgi:hypothetical protein
MVHSVFYSMHISQIIIAINQFKEQTAACMVYYSEKGSRWIYAVLMIHIQWALKIQYYSILCETVYTPFPKWRDVSHAVDKELVNNH